MVKSKSVKKPVRKSVKVNKIQELKELKRSSADQFFFNPVMGTLNLSSYANYSNQKALKLSTVYRAINIISTSIGVLPLINYEIRGNQFGSQWKYELNDNLTYLLNVAPNNIMSSYTFKTQMVQYIITQGNAYIHIIRGLDGEISELRLLDSNFIRVLVDNQQIYYNSYLVYGEKSYHNVLTGEVYNDADIIHILGFSVNSMVGISVIQSAAMALGIAYSSENQALQSFENGGALRGLLKPVVGANIGAGKAKKAKEDFLTASNVDLGGSSIIALDSAWDYQPISVSAKDNELLDSRKFNIINIAQFFGTPPEKLFDMTHSRNGTSEAAQIEFYNSCLLGYIEKIENEFFHKIYERVMYPIRELEFDIENLMRLDSVASATYYKTMFELGAYTSNEIREKINARNPMKGGNEAYISTNLQKLSNPVVQGTPAISGNTGTQLTGANFVDNKLL